jgi:hypothetical protein
MSLQVEAPEQTDELICALLPPLLTPHRTSQSFPSSPPQPAKTIYNNTGAFTLDDLLAIVPNTLAAFLANPSPPQPSK